MRQRSAGSLLLAAAAGLLHTASFAPLEWWWAQIAALALLAALMRDASPRRAAALAWVFAFTWLGSGLWWLFNSLYFHGHMLALLAAAAVALLAAGLALYYALAVALWAAWRGPLAETRPLRAALGWAAAWSLAELARGSWFTGFPWIAGGYAHTGGPLAGWAPYVGVYGIGMAAAWIAVSLAQLAHRLRTRGPMPYGALLPLVLLVAGPLLPQDLTQSTGRLSVTLLQTNVPQDVKFTYGHISTVLHWHIDQFRAARGDLVVTPETSLPVLRQRIDIETWQAYREPFMKPGRGALVGVFTGSEESGYRNSVIGISAASDPTRPERYVYSKRHLLPFGEFVPPGLGWFVRTLAIPIGDQVPGTHDRAFAVGAQRVRPLICYEDLFGEDIVDSVQGPQGATVLANVSNLAWFGPLMMQDQHLQFSRMRTLEFQRPLVRATNTGATAAIDHRGQVTARLAPEVEGVLDATIEGRTGATPYARWLGAAGLWPLWIALLGVFGWHRRLLPQRAQA